MSLAEADEGVRAVLYEGYVLYPYRPTSTPQPLRWAFGGLYPPADPAAGATGMAAQFLVTGETTARLEVRVRFLQPVTRQITGVVPAMPSWPDEAETAYAVVASLQCEGRDYHGREESIEREVRLPTASLEDLADGIAPVCFAFVALHAREPIVTRDGRTVGAIVRNQEATSGTLTVGATRLEGEPREAAWRIEVRVENTSAVSDAEVLTKDIARWRAFMSTHIVAGIEGGAFVSLIDPPAAFAAAARTCTNRNAWPILVGIEGSGDPLLCAPIILCDHPEGPSEPPIQGDDRTRIDEIPALRILTMTDTEKAEWNATGERERALTARTEALSQEQRLRMHGVVRGRRAGAGEVAVLPLPRLATLVHGDTELRVGDRVRLEPRIAEDSVDPALAGRVAVIDSIEIDFENRVHVAVTIEDPDFQGAGIERTPGPRLFLSPDEIRRLAADEARP